MDPRTRIEAALAEHDPPWRLQWLDATELRARSRGRITNAHGLNHRTLKPERGGLLCCRIFGPVEELSCVCTKYQGPNHRGITCEKCGVEVLEVSVRCERFGHIELPVGVPHPWDDTRSFEALLVLPAGFREQSPGDLRVDLRGLNGLYQRVYQRAEALARCIEHLAPSLIVEHETTLLHQAIARLFGRPRQRPGTGPTLTAHLQRALLELDASRPPPSTLVATLAALGLTLEAAGSPAEP
ncbi:hypothetical protein [Paraliomyxa miuraensis]|uniref:hypothetical protein n=1 Tax=Paraliomyxa miuraensis TaxID=376150 RepID=UPI00225199C8|nr:hypothetical protein [Paraliomyxa miuraensis]MCX4239315.1 hypothetical protein [Paraliomyxa miuraensis]